MMKSLSSKQSKSYTFLKLGRVLACFFFIFSSILVFSNTTTEIDPDTNLFVESNNIFYASSDVTIISIDSTESNAIEFSDKQIVKKENTTESVRNEKEIIIPVVENSITIHTAPASQSATSSFKISTQGNFFQTQTNLFLIIPSILRSVIYFAYPMDSNWKYIRNQKRGLFSYKYFSRPPPSIKIYLKSKSMKH